MLANRLRSVRKPSLWQLPHATRLKLLSAALLALFIALVPAAPAALADLDGDGALELPSTTASGVQVFPGTGTSGGVNGSNLLELWLDAGLTGGEPDELIDRSENANNGTLYNFGDEPDLAFHSSGQPPVQRWITFDGVDDMVGTDDFLDAPHVMTMVVWFRTTTAGGKLAGFEDETTGDDSLFDRHLYIDSEGHLRFGVWNGAAVTPASLSPVTDGDWHMAVATIDLVNSQAVAALYLDGQLQETVTTSPLNSYDGYWRLGGGNLNGWPEAPSSHFFKGDIGSLRVYSRVLSPEEIASEASPQPTPVVSSGNGLPAPLARLTAVARSDDDPLVLLDVTGNGNDGTLYNFDDVEAAFGDGPPSIGRHINFDGVDDLIGIGTQMAAPLNFSIVVRFRTTTAAGKVVGFHSSIDGASEDSDRHMYIDSDGILRFGVQRGTESIHLTSLHSGEPVADGEWHLAIGTVRVVGSQVEVTLYVDGQRNGPIETEPILDYFGYWRLGGGDIGVWPDTPNAFFKGDISEFIFYDVALTESQAAILSGTADQKPEATATPPEDDDPEAGVNISSNVDGETLTLNVTFFNVPSLDQATVYVVREDGTEFLAGPGAAQLSWTGEAVTGLYRVEARVASGGDGQTVIASSTVPVLVPIATPKEIGVAVGVGVAVAAAGSAAAASGFSAYDFIARLLKIVVLEKMRKKTKHVDLKRLPSWIAAVLAIVLMAVFLTLARPGALEFRSLGEAFVVATTAAVVLRSFTLAGGIFLAFITGQKPRYLLWLAGTASFAITGILFHAPFGYTGYMDRKPGNVHRDARFAVAGFSVMLAVAGVFLFIGSLTDLVFAETGITLVLSGLAASMLPFPFMGGNALWKWNKLAGATSGIIGLTPYSFFMYGRLPLEIIYVLGALGFAAFAAIMVSDRLIMKREEREESAALEPEVVIADAPATVAEPEAPVDTSAVTTEEPEDGPAPAVAPIAPTAEVITPRNPAVPAADNSATPDKGV